LRIDFPISSIDPIDRYMDRKPKSERATEAMKKSVRIFERALGGSLNFTLLTDLALDHNTCITLGQREMMLSYFSRDNEPLLGTYEWWCTHLSLQSAPASLLTPFRPLPTTRLRPLQVVNRVNPLLHRRSCARVDMTQPFRSLILGKDVQQRLNKASE
jgi:hypothetical protein